MLTKPLEPIRFEKTENKLKEMPSQLHASLSEHGFVILPALLHASELSALRSACDAAVAFARSGKWPYIRTLPKQFPPWGSDASNGIWGVQHLLHPSLPHHREFARSYFFPAILAAAGQVMDCSEDELVMELYNLLVRPDRDFALRWHRDDVSADASEAEEERRLANGIDGTGRREYTHAQWNLALWDDESLLVVPGSHRRARTEAEREADPYKADLEGQVVVKLRPGDAVFYDNNILHRGVYKADRQRMTLHGSMGKIGAGEERARNVLQHGVGEWVETCNFSDLPVEVREKAEKMKERFMTMGKGANVGYSHDD